jgi:hypothetical protein
MKTLGHVALGVAVLAGASSFVASAQTMISAKSGVIHYAEGRVYVGDQLVETKFGSFPDIKENVQLRTEEGRAEVLLTPGVFLRVGENSSFRMVTNRLIDTRVEFLSGSMLVEADELLKDNGVTIAYNDYSVQVLKKGIYRFDSDPPALRVYDGEVLAQINGKTEQVGAGHLLAMNGELKLARFNKEQVDDLYLWSRKRSEYISMANVSAAKSLRDSGTSWYSSGWAFNPYFNMYTFIPYRGAYYNPFGFALWSPFTVYDYLYSPGFYNTGYAYGGGGVSRGVSSSGAHTVVGTTHSGLSGTVASSGGSSRSVSSSASSSLSSPVSHSSGGSFGGGGFGGGGGGHAGGHGK